MDQPAAQAKPEGEMRWALYVTLSPVWFDPGEVVGQITAAGRRGAGAPPAEARL